jgi:hypothetical protein
MLKYRTAFSIPGALTDIRTWYVWPVLTVPDTEAFVTLKVKSVMFGPGNLAYGAFGMVVESDVVMFQPMGAFA